MILTKELLEEARSSNGQFSKKQIELLGLKINKLWHGWQKSIIGNNYPNGTISNLILLKDKHIYKPFKHPKPTNKYSYTENNLKTINEAKNNMLIGLKKINLDD